MIAEPSATAERGRPSTASPQGGALAEATADVIVASRQIITDGVDLMRLQLKEDLQQIMTVLAFGTVAVVACSVALTAGAVAVVFLLKVWIPVGAALGVVTTVALAGGLGLAGAARKRLPRRSVEIEEARAHPSIDNPDRKQMVQPARR